MAPDMVSIFPEWKTIRLGIGPVGMPNPIVIDKVIIARNDKITLQVHIVLK